MTPRQLTGRIIQRTARVLVVTTLALGLTTTVHASAPAFATPLHGRTEGSDRPDLVPFADQPTLEERKIHLFAGVENQGSGAAEEQTLRFQFAPDLFDIAVEYAGDFTCVISDNVVACTSILPLVDADARGVNLSARASSLGTYHVNLTVDPSDRIAESNEENNETVLIAVVE